MLPCMHVRIYIHLTTLLMNSVNDIYEAYTEEFTVIKDYRCYNL